MDWLPARLRSDCAAADFTASRELSEAARIRTSTASATSAMTMP
jgi:hypothetical protein